MMLTNNRIPLLALAVTAMAMLGAISVPIGRPARGQGKSTPIAVEKRGHPPTVAPSARVAETPSREG